MAIVLNGQTNDVTIDGVSVATESEAVLKTGNETIAGVKTFSSSPIVPNATTATQAMAYGQGVNLTAAQTIAGVKTFNNNVGIGVTPSAWLPSKRAIELPSTAISDNGLGGIAIGSNGYTNTSGQDIYRFNGYASTIAQFEGNTYFYTAPSGLAGNPITWKTAMTLDAGGKLSLTGVSNASDYEQVRFNKLNGTANTVFYGIDGVASTSIFSGMTIGKHVANSRSINATGTINASGADYAEYEQNNGIAFSKGQIVGFKADGTLTNKYNEAIRFAIKSTNPSYVGGDTWGNEEVIGKRPEQPVKKEEQTDEEFVEIEEQYKAELVIFETKLEFERQKVDRVAYSGKVPLNVHGAIAGQYIVAIEKDGGIDGLAVNKDDMTFVQYQDTVGRVNKILEDGRAEVAVIIH